MQHDNIQDKVRTCKTKQHNTKQHKTIQYDINQYDTIQHNTIQDDIRNDNTMQYVIIQDKTIKQQKTIPDKTRQVEEIQKQDDTQNKTR